MDAVDGCNIGTGGGSSNVLRGGLKSTACSPKQPQQEHQPLQPSPQKYQAEHQPPQPSPQQQQEQQQQQPRRRVRFQGETETVTRLYKHYVEPPVGAGRFSKYWVALRPWSFSASFVPVLLGTALAYKSYAAFDLRLFLLSSFVAFCVHGAGNLVNTYYDYFKGIDTSGSSRAGHQPCDDRTLVDNILTPAEVSNYGVSLYALGTAGFLLLGWLSPAPVQLLALVYFGGLSASFLYTGGVGLKYIALGDLAILLTFGPLTVFFSFVSQCGVFDVFPLLYALPLAFLAEAILHSNNARDAASDDGAGIVTLAILVGDAGAYVVFVGLVFAPYLTFLFLGWRFSYWLWFPLVTLPKAFELEKRFKERDLRRIPQKTAKLNLFCGLFYVLSIIMCRADELPGLAS